MVNTWAIKWNLVKLLNWEEFSSLSAKLVLIIKLLQLAAKIKQEFIQAETL
jgi:hypothetical protein